MVMGFKMIPERKYYLDKLIFKKDNGLVNTKMWKILFELHHSYLNSTGIVVANIIELALDDVPNARYRNPIKLDSYILGCRIRLRSSMFQISRIHKASSGNKFTQ